MQIKEITKKNYTLSSRANAIALAHDLMVNETVEEVNFSERTWATDPDQADRFEIRVTYKPSIR
jgi:hypothetical protein